MIERAVDAMNSLIADLLDISSIESGTLAIDRQAHDVGELMAELGELFAAAAEEKGIAFTIDVDDNTITIPMDRHRILQVLSNLVGNALKFTPEGGRIHVAATLAPDGVLFSVADSGDGISPETMEHIFDRYWHSAQETHDGHGLGLSIASGIVEAHGSTLRVETRPGQGSTFSFLLPSARI
jgi:signal transduction histidine kinase